MMTARTPLECAILIVEISARLVVGVIALLVLTAVMTGLLWFMGVTF